MFLEKLVLICTATSNLYLFLQQWRRLYVTWISDLHVAQVADYFRNQFYFFGLAVISVRAFVRLRRIACEFQLAIVCVLVDARFQRFFYLQWQLLACAYIYLCSFSCAIIINCHTSIEFIAPKILLLWSSVHLSTCTTTRAHRYSTHRYINETQTDAYVLPFCVSQSITSRTSTIILSNSPLANASAMIWGILTTGSLFHASPLTGRETVIFYIFTSINSISIIPDYLRFVTIFLVSVKILFSFVLQRVTLLNLP